MIRCVKAFSLSQKASTNLQMYEIPFSFVTSFSQKLNIVNPRLDVCRYLQPIMNSEKIEFEANKSKTVWNTTRLVSFVIILFIIYFLIRLLINPEYEIGIGTIAGVITFIMWTFLFERNVTNIIFDNGKRKLLITNRSLILNKKEDEIEYDKLKYEIKQNKSLLGLIRGKKSINISTDYLDILNISHFIGGFNDLQIDQIEDILKNNFN